MMKKILLFGVSILFCMVEFYSFSQDNAQNWANFKHYAEQNKLLKATVIVPKRVVFIGNSICGSRHRRTNILSNVVTFP